MIKNRKYVNDVGIRKVVQDIKIYINDQDKNLKSDIDLLENALTNEIIRAETQEANLQGKLDANHTLTDAKIASVNKRVDDEIINRNNEINDKLALQYKQVTTDISNAKKEIAADRTELLDAIQTDIDNNEETARVATQTEFERATKTEGDLNALTTSNKSSLVAAINSEKARAEESEASLQKQITDSDKDYESLKLIVDTHVADKNSIAVSAENPHGITTDKIGAATKSEHDALTNRVLLNETTINDHETRLSAAEDTIELLQDNVSNLQDTTVKVTGNNQKIEGDLTIIKNSSGASGNLTIQGDLVVKGTTTTVEHETLTVKDNFVVINSDNEEVGTSLTGIAIRTGKDSQGNDTTYGIVYDKTNDSVSLGSGAYNNGDFVFKEGESKPILTRDVSSNIQDGHLLVWDADKNIAVDGGAYDLETLKNEFSTWEDNHKLAAEINELDNTDITSGRLGRVTIVENTIKDELLPRIEQVEVNIDNVEMALEKEQEERANEDSKINKTLLEVKEELDTHIIDNENPHTVNWAQIKEASGSGDGAVFSAIAPAMDGDASAGSAETASRSDHRHPTDTTRAPKVHSATDTTYGAATTGLYGHVKYDENVKNGDQGVVCAKAVREYVEEVTQSLKSDPVTYSASKTISSFKQENGVVSITEQDIQISKTQVTNLVADLEQHSADIKNNTNNIKTNADNIAGLRSELEDESSFRENGDVATLQAANQYTDDQLSTSLNKTDAEVPISSNLLFTHPFGKFKPGMQPLVTTNPDGTEVTIADSTSGSVRIYAKDLGWSIHDLLTNAFSEVSVGNVDYPSESFRVYGITEGELGSEYTAPYAIFTVDDVGSYQYGPETGIKYNLRLSGGGNTLDSTYSDLESGASKTIYATSGGTYGMTARTYEFKATYSYTEGAVPQTNIGSQMQSERIPAKEESVLKTEITYQPGYRCMFMGVVDNLDYIDSSYIRNKLVKRKSTTGTYTVDAQTNDTRIIWAVPSNENRTLSFKYSLFGNWEKLVVAESSTVQVTDASGNNPIDYDVYVYSPSGGSFEAGMSTQVMIN